MALRIPSTGASPRRTGEAGRRRHLSCRLRSDPQSAGAPRRRHAGRSEAVAGNHAVEADGRRTPFDPRAVDPSTVPGHGRNDTRHPRRAVWRTGRAAAEGNRLAAAGARRGADPPRGDRRQLHRRLLPHRLLRSLRLPGVPGMEAAGVIEAVGSAISGLSVGDRVAYACPPVGAYAERRNMMADLLAVPVGRHFGRSRCSKPAQGRVGQLPAA
ncbi:alcohol dehydrogenase catalytic domain-containing protein [Mesorhizobium atlanticum]